MDIVETRRENLRRWVATNGTPAKERSFFSQLQKDASFGERVARRLEQQYKMGAGYLDRPIGPGVSQAPGVFDENVSRVPMGTRPIPVISSVQAGALRDMDAPYEPGDGYAVVYTDDMALSRWTFSLEVEGESMMPRFQPGDLLIVDPELSPNPGNFVVARNGTNQATFKKYRPRGIDERGNMIFELVPLNEDYPTMRSDVEKLTILGVVVEHRNKLR